MTPAIEHTLPIDDEPEAPTVGPSQASYVPNNAVLAGFRELLTAWEKLVQDEITQEEYCAVCKRLGALEKALEAHYKAKEKR